MKKRIFSTLLALCMLLCLMPTAAFAEESTETPPVCSCETACTADNMNKECPVCGAENAIPQNCGQYIPVEDRTGENGSTERADDPNGPTELSAADQVQAMIDGLPNAEEITEDNAEEVKAQLEAIDEAKEKLSDEEIDELDMTRYAEAAAALGALAAPMLLANDSPDEQFSLALGGTYYFDLSGENIPGTANGSLPDASLHYVPFTYAGTVNAYKLTTEMATTEEYDVHAVSHQGFGCHKANKVMHGSLRAFEFMEVGSVFEQRYSEEQHDQRIADADHRIVQALHYAPYRPALKSLRAGCHQPPKLC